MGILFIKNVQNTYKYSYIMGKWHCECSIWKSLRFVSFPYYFFSPWLPHSL